MKGIEAFTSGPTALSVSVLCKSSAQGWNRGTGRRKEQEREKVCMRVRCVLKATEDMIAGRDVRSL